MSDNIEDRLMKRMDFVKLLGAGVASLLIPGCDRRPKQPIEYARGLQKIADMEHERYYCSVLSHKKLIHILGGSNDYNWTWPTAKYSTFDPENLIWNPREKMDKALIRMASFVFEGDIMTVGGIREGQGTLGRGPGVDYVFRHDMDNNKWHTLKPFNFPISRAQAVVTDGTPFIVGGYIKNEETNLDILVYDKSEDNWEVKTKIPKPVDNITAAAKDGKIYVFGGYDQQEDKRIWLLQVYDTQKEAWEPELISLGEKFQFTHAFIHDDDPCLWVCNAGVIGGSSPYRSNPIQDHAMFSTVGNKWGETNISTAVPDGMAYYAMKVVHDGHLYFVGPQGNRVAHTGEIHRFRLPGQQALYQLL